MAMFAPPQAPADAQDSDHFATPVVAVNDARPCGHFASVGHRFSPNNLLLHRSSYGRGVRQGYVAPPFIVALCPDHLRFVPASILVSRHDITPMGYLDLQMISPRGEWPDLTCNVARQLIPLRDPGVPWGLCNASVPRSTYYIILFSQLGFIIGISPPIGLMLPLCRERGVCRDIKLDCAQF